MDILVILKQFGLQHLQGLFLVLQLGALGLASDNQTRGNVGQTERGFDLVDVLAALAAGAKSIKLDVVPPHLKLDIIDFRHDIHGGKGSVTPLVGVKGGNTNQPVYALFNLEKTIGPGALYKERN